MPALLQGKVSRTKIAAWVKQAAIFITGKYFTASDVF